MATKHERTYTEQFIFPAASQYTTAYKQRKQQATSRASQRGAHEHAVRQKLSVLKVSIFKHSLNSETINCYQSRVWGVSRGNHLDHLPRKYNNQNTAISFCNLQLPLKYCHGHRNKISQGIWNHGRRESKN
jgi:hypothetical protein